MGFFKKKRKYNKDGFIDIQIKKLIEWNEPNGKSSKRKTLIKEFEEIVKTGNDEEIKEVFEKCDINAYESGLYRSNALAFNLSQEMMIWMVEHGADIEYKDRFKNTPLHTHAGKKEGHPEYLIRLGANLETKNSRKETPLFDAVNYYCLKNVQILVEAGANVNVKNFIGKTPLLSVLTNARLDQIPMLVAMVKYLLAHGARLTGKEKEQVQRIREEFNCVKEQLNKDEIEKLEMSLRELCKIFRVKIKPLPKKIIYDGKSKITVKSKTWQEQNKELWELLVPINGPASTIQGEVIRICGRLSYEILDNGRMNWDSEFIKLATVLPKYLNKGNLLPDEEYEEVKMIINDLKNVWNNELRRLTELCVKWVLLNQEPLSLDKVQYNR